MMNVQVFQNFELKIAEMTIK